MSFCYQCGKPVEDGMKFCAWCGAAVATSAPSAVPAQVVAPVEATVPMDDPTVIEEAPVKKSRKKWFWLLGAVALVVIIAMVLTMVLGGKATWPSYVMYVKNGKLYYNSGTNAESMKIGEVEYFLFSRDGKQLFYLEGDKLYYCNVGGNDKTMKLDTGVSSFQINDKGTEVLYLKDGTLYFHNLKGKEKIKANVYDFAGNRDFSTIVFAVVEDGDVEVFAKHGNKIIEDAYDIDIDTDVSAFTTDLETVWYLDDDVLYKQEIGKKAKEIVDDVYQVYYVYESGEVYYSKNFDSDTYGKDLYYFDGKKERLVHRDMRHRDVICEERPVIVFEDEEQTYVAVKDKAVAVDAEDSSVFLLTTDGKTLYFMDEVENDVGTLRQARVGNSLEKSVIYDTNVHEDSLDLKDDKPLYYKNVTEDGNKLYWGGECVANDVSMVSYNEDIGLMYITNYDTFDGALFEYKNGRSKHIASDVEEYDVLENRNIVYIVDYEDGEGTLCLYKNGKSLEIDNGVETFKYEQITSRSTIFMFGRFAQWLSAEGLEILNM